MKRITTFVAVVVATASLGLGAGLAVASSDSNGTSSSSGDAERERHAQIRASWGTMPDGRTFGGAPERDGDPIPDLVAVSMPNSPEGYGYADSGYVYNLDEVPPASPEEAVARERELQRAIEEGQDMPTTPIYDAEGNVIGEYSHDWS